MLIESRIKPVAPKTYRTITLFGTTYEFRALLPNRYVADVADAKHAKTFLDNPAYAKFDGELPAPALQRGAATEPVNAVIQPTAVAVTTKDELPESGDAEAEDEAEETTDEAGEEDLAAGGASDEPGEWSTAVADEAAVLLRNPPAKLAVAIGKVTHIDVLRCALALERNKTGKQKPREDVVALIEGTLRDIAAAS